MSSSRHVISFTISLSLLGIQVLPGYFSYVTKDVIRVAYLGIHFQDVEENHQKSINTRIARLIEKQNGLYYISGEEIQTRLDATLINEIKVQMGKEDFRKAAKLLNVDYVFAGRMENQSKNKEISALVGNIARYDVATDNLYKLKIQSFFEDFNEELVRINNQLINSIVPEQRKGFFKRYLPGIIIVAATAIAITLLLGGTDGQSSGDNGGQRPPFTVH